jgi:hypothetical protein
MNFGFPSVATIAGAKWLTWINELWLERGRPGRWRAGRPRSVQPSLSEPRGTSRPASSGLDKMNSSQLRSDEDERIGYW